ncbi:MAG TPA: PAS domain S-box protein [Vicinamibacterales bacterium]|nr:PAS domain S-box protein [Vicinamibacterales bacterium]
MELKSVTDLVDQALKTCLNHAAEGVHFVGPDGTILWANQTELDLLGYTPDEYIGHNIVEFHVHRPVIDDILERLTRGETLLSYEARLRHKDGTVRDVEINANVLWRDGELLHTRCFTRDVTIRKSTDEIANRLADIVEHSDDAIVSKDLNGIITSWNPAAERMFGRTAAEATGQSILMIIPADRRREEDEVLRQIRSGARVEPFETVRQRKDGTLIDISVTVSPVRNRQGRVVGASKIARDISDRKRIEARDRLLVQLDDAVRPLTEADAITSTVTTGLGQHLGVHRCAFAIVEDDQDTFVVAGNYASDLQSIVGRYTFGQFGEECLRLMRAGLPYVVSKVESDPRITLAARPSYAMTAIRAIVCVPILKTGRLVAAMAVHVAVPRQWQAGEVELVQQVASRCWDSLERARFTRELRESERQFRELANSIANLAWMARPDGWILWFNDQWYAYTGATPGHMDGWGWHTVHDPAVLSEFTERWQRSLATGTPFEMVFPLRRADGEFRRFLTRANPVRDSYGQIVHWFGTCTDVETERSALEANELLRELEQMARREAELQKRLLYSLFMQAPTIIGVLSGPNHVIELANPAVCQVWGKSEDELRDRPLFEAMPELRDQAVMKLLDEVYRTGVPAVGRETPATLERPDGTTGTIYINYVYSPRRNVHGEVEGVFVVASEVTDQVIARHQMDRLREQAEGANRAKDEFLAMLGHELRNPLSPILTALQLMKLRGSDASEKERTVIERQVNHLTRLVDDLLDVSRIARGKVELKAEVVEIAEVVARAIEQASPLLEQRAHKLTVRVPRHDLSVLGDSIRLSQVVSNLLTNAAKYTGSGGSISVRAEEEGGMVVLRVRDTGIGIAPDVLPRIFDLFVQERQASDRSNGGLGLGLTIVRNLVERHGGTVSAYSDGPSHGSEFVVRLPKAGAASLVGTDLLLPSRMDARKAPPGARRILVVDDNEDSAEMLAEALKARGYQTRVSLDAPAALLVASEFCPDLAFLDIGLPVMDGYELARRLREVPGLERIRLVALTGYGQESDRRRTRAAGFHHHLVKPVDLQVVEAVVASEGQL